LEVSAKNRAHAIFASKFLEWWWGGLTKLPVIFMRVFEIVLALMGIALVAVSLVLYQTRTRDKKFLTRFWLGRDLLTGREYALNRLGFVLWLVAVAMASVSVARTWMHHR
jgi:hypothetical protein